MRGEYVVIAIACVSIFMSASASAIPGPPYQLTHIQFDYKPNSSPSNSLDGLRIRKNWSQDLNYWAYGGSAGGAGEYMSILGVSEPALYIEDNYVTIRVRLTGEPNTSAFISALSNNNDFPGVYGATVSFDSDGISIGDNGFVKLWLDSKIPTGPKFVTADWEWSFSDVDGEESLPVVFHYSSHAIFIVPSMPSAPWYTSSSTYPLLDALTFLFDSEICDINGSISIDDAIYKTVSFCAKKYDYEHEMGNPSFTQLNTNTNYLSIDLQSFLDEDPNFDSKVNCYDCTASLVALANILGDSLKSRFYTATSSPANVFFGYIHYTKMTGYENYSFQYCNNPFYKKTSVTGGRAVGADYQPPIRIPFANHMFAFRLQGFRCFDSCSNLGTGPSLPNYFALVQDQTHPSESQWDHDTNSSTPSLNAALPLQQVVSPIVEIVGGFP